MPAVALQPSRTVEELAELRELTGDEDGAQRVAWTDTCVRAREWLSGKLEPLGVKEETDEAGHFGFFSVARLRSRSFFLRWRSFRHRLIGRDPRPMRPGSL